MNKISTAALFVGFGHFFQRRKRLLKETFSKKKVAITAATARTGVGFDDWGLW
ncbi:hypothetical protein SERLA73DRAFT_122201 [Serpula lacrymans var. lacrymans S7.3]|uniref:Uncharacterized protein n=2 Tax=Serpula lacrymans var. lacrymans TaxID=341189 RepID=F8PV34_SERL3|nr:uncharacterized protein SERLADRAFT_369079 [Serpula lacrymans var. lacrymans S7.9]EGO00114.1 hypothetical protein SERLA73DRAFT_122201 [Serpula lacrymans var. lacrymans S7.3]EGO25676.1 hypothetical protein SERLADRAFT_369079 [Serpula lacrymans var. lacrymans S7.9]